MFHKDLTRTGYSTSEAPLTNQTLWTYTTGGYVNDPAVVNGVVYIGSYDYKVYALNAKTGNLIWNYTTGGYVDTAPTVANGVVFINSNDNKTYAVDAASGSLIWSFATRRRLDSSPAVAGGVVFTCSADRNVYALNATNGALIWNYTTRGTVMLSSPAVAENAVFIGAGRNIYSLNATSGTLLWNYTAHSVVDSSPAVTDGLVFVGSADHNVYALNASTGMLVWNYTTGGYVDSGPAVAYRTVFVGSADHNVYALDAYTGSLMWNYSTGNVVAGSPAVADDIVFVGSLDNKVYALNATNGVPVWTYTTGGLVVSSPAAVDGIVYLGSWDHKVYAFGQAPNAKSLLSLDVMFLGLAVFGIALCIFLFVFRRKKLKKHITDSSAQRNKVSNEIKISKFEVNRDTLTLFVTKGFVKKKQIIVKEILLREITKIEQYENVLRVTWKGCTATFLAKNSINSFSKLSNEVNQLLEKQKKLSEDKKKAALRKSELLATVKSSLGIIDLSFDVLFGLNEKRVNWELLQGYFDNFKKSFNFNGQIMLPLTLDFSGFFSAVEKRNPREVAIESFKTLEIVNGYFESAQVNCTQDSFLDFQNAKAEIRAYFLLNDLLLGLLVGDKENPEEKEQLRGFLQNFANRGSRGNFNANIEELNDIHLSGLDNNVEKIAERFRRIFKDQLDSLNPFTLNKS